MTSRGSALWLTLFCGCAHAGRNSAIPEIGGLVSLFTGTESCAELRANCEAQAGDLLEACRSEVDLRCTGDIAERELELKATMAVAPRAAALNDLGTILFYKSPADYVGACGAFEQAMTLDPGFVIARENYMSCLLRRAMVAETLEARWLLVDTVTSVAKSLLAKSPRHDRAERALGLVELILKRYERSMPHFQRCLEYAPLEPSCSHFLGVALLGNGRCASARLKFEAAERMCQDAPAVCGPARRGLRTAALACGQPDPNPDDQLDVVLAGAKRHFDLGLIYAETGALAKAEAEWTTAVDTDPHHCPSHLRLALVARERFDQRLAARRCEDYLSCILGRTNDEPTTLWGDGPRKCQQIAFGRPVW